MAYGTYAPFYRGGFFNPYQQTQNPMDMGQGQYGNPYATQQQGGMPQNPSQTAPTQQTNDIIWVQGEAGAKAYLVAPNNTVTLWDSESPTIYVKSADMNGVPSMRVLDFVERTPNTTKTASEHTCKCGDRFVKVEDFKALEGKFEALQAKIDNINVKEAEKNG